MWPERNKRNKIDVFERHINVRKDKQGLMVDALTQSGDEGRGVTAISFGEVCSNL